MVRYRVLDVRCFVNDSGSGFCALWRAALRELLSEEAFYIRSVCAHWIG